MFLIRENNTEGCFRAVGENNYARFFIIAKEGLHFRLRVIEFEPLTVVVFKFAVLLNKRPYFLGGEFFYTEDIVFEMSCEVK